MKKEILLNIITALFVIAAIALIAYWIYFLVNAAKLIITIILYIIAAAA